MAKQANKQVDQTKKQMLMAVDWPAPGSKDTELGVLVELEVGHGKAEVYARVRAWGGTADQGAACHVAGLAGSGCSSVTVTRLGEGAGG